MPGKLGIDPAGVTSSDLRNERVFCQDGGGSPEFGCMMPEIEISHTASEALKCKKGACMSFLALLYKHRRLCMHAVVEHSLQVFYLDKWTHEGSYLSWGAGWIRLMKRVLQSDEESVSFKSIYLRLCPWERISKQFLQISDM